MVSAKFYNYLFIICMVLIMGCGGQQDSLKYRMETEHFKYYCYDCDVEVLDALGRELEANFDRITDHLLYLPPEKIDVEVYPSVKTFHTCLGYPNSPAWAVGFAGNGKVQIVSPANPGPAHTYESLMLAAVHEFTHLIVRGHNSGKIPIWLNEGIACFEAKNITDIQYGVGKWVRDGRVPTFADLEEKFSALNGYQYSYTIVEFLVEEYSYEILVELIINPDIPAVFGISDDELYQEWVSYLEEHYQ